MAGTDDVGDDGDSREFGGDYDILLQDNVVQKSYALMPPDAVKRRANSRLLTHQNEFHKLESVAVIFQ